MVNSLFSIGPLAIPMLQCFFLLGNWISLWNTTLSYWHTGYLNDTRSFPIGPLAISMVHFYLLLSYWLSIWYTSLSYEPTDYPYDTLQIYWTTGYLYGTLPSFTGPLDITMAHYYLLLTHWISLMSTTLSY